MNFYRKIKIRAIQNETRDARTFILASEVPIAYQAGQFLTFVFPSHSGEVRRSYSLSSSPALNEAPAITVKRIPNGEFSRWLIDKAKAGDELLTIGASGLFTLPSDERIIRQVFFFAAGSGISPIFSLLKSVLIEHPEWRAVLIYSNHEKKDIIFHRQLMELQDKYPHQLQIEFLLSTSPDLARARLSKWLLHILITQYSMAGWDETIFYICGPFDYMRMVTIQLLAEGVPSAHIRKEIFTIVRPATRLMPPDKEAHQVEILFDGQRYDITVQYPETVLSEARKQGIDLPYSCEAGRCGACVATCHQGKLWMRYNEVLMDEELRRGRVLTCVGYPVGGDVKLSFS